MAGTATQIAALGTLARTILDVRLSRLKQAVEARDESLRQMAGLDQVSCVPGMDAVAAELARLRYERWADKRRVELKRLVVIQNDEIARLQAEAQSAFGRSDVLGRLQETARRR